MSNCQSSNESLLHDSNYNIGLLVPTDIRSVVMFVHNSLVQDKVTLQKIERTEMYVNIMTSWVASINTLIGALLPALCSDWLSDVMGSQLHSYMLYLM
jgi:hypothetical protein